MVRPIVFILLFVLPLAAEDSDVPSIKEIL
jgi:hypothetical protein